MVSQIGRFGSKKPSLSDYDHAKPRDPDYGTSSHLPTDVVYSDGHDAMLTRWVGGDDWSNAGLIGQLYIGRMHRPDKDLLIEHGVDGDVPFERAVRNAGLVIVGKGRATRIVAANDNVPAAERMTG